MPSKPKLFGLYVERGAIEDCIGKNGCAILWSAKKPRMPAVTTRMTSYTFIIGFLRGGGDSPNVP